MKVYNINQNGTDISPDTRELHELKDWVDSFAPDGCSEKDFKIIQQNTDNYDFSHCGLIYYLHGCWAKELGCVLKPDMIYQTILSAITKCILKNPTDFKFLFMDGDTKQNVVVVVNNADKGSFDINKLDAILKNITKNKEFYNLISNTSFTTDGELGKHVRLMTYANMGVPYFNYISTMCGIKSVSVDGTQFDYEKLLVNLVQINRIFEMNAKFIKNNTSIFPFLKKTIETISDILHYTFDNKYKAFNLYDSPEDFYNNIFHYGENTKCGSGHDQFKVYGWARNFYSTHGEDLSHFESTLCYVPYHNIETNKTFVQVAGMTHSKIINNIAYPEYNKIGFEITNRDTFDKLAHQNN
ncbi:hypothetical protein crov453 [Cafeteria roenbergensis virus]|uniref:Uncharacterized protein n=1 Tax=Cafeteria roenbergensis virus (strain BV-PW1) TaxID=693272 RepID=E3T5M4_CROVB|nr:hypothetical protein crov453 [Cafeteria roenbergensis virus BV-PW1]ADO67487.1 hypothetical protein crov453 [Cafeteria roenbergensis virus BV-PW1]